MIVTVLIKESEEHTIESGLYTDQETKEFGD